jgi:Phosphotransferase enzyme family
MNATDQWSSINRISEPMAATDRAAVNRALQRFTTPGCLSEILLSHVPECVNGTSSVADCAVLDSRFKTYLNPHNLVRSTLSACYSVRFNEGATGISSGTLFYIKAFLGGRSREAYARLPGKDATCSERGRKVMHIPELDLILWRFPDDPELRSLTELMDPETVRHHLPAQNLSPIMGNPPFRVLDIEIVNYRPEIRCTNRYQVVSRRHNHPYTVFGKTYRKGEGRHLSERWEYFWDRSLSEPDGMAVARPLGYTPAVSTLWQLGVEGTPLHQVLDESNFSHYLAATAKGLATLHHSDVPGLAAHSPEDHLTEVRKKVQKLSAAIPHLAGPLGTIARHLEQTAPRRSDIPFRPIHWDFHIHQLLACKGKLVFCDLDELVIGDPVQDLANFIVDLHFRTFHRHFVRLLSGELCRTYRQHVPWDVPAERLAWHACIQFVNKAYRHYLRFAPGFEQSVEQIIRLAEGELAQW